MVGVGKITQLFLYNSKNEQEYQIVSIRPGWPRFEQIVQGGEK